MALSLKTLPPEMLFEIARAAADEKTEEFLFFRQTLAFSLCDRQMLADLQPRITLYRTSSKALPSDKYDWLFFLWYYAFGMTAPRLHRYKFYPEWGTAALNALDMDNEWKLLWSAARFEFTKQTGEQPPRIFFKPAGFPALPPEIVYNEIFGHLEKEKKQDWKLRAVSRSVRRALKLPESPSFDITLSASKPLQNFGHPALRKEPDFSYARRICLSITKSSFRHFSLKENERTRLDWFLTALEKRPPQKLETLCVKLLQWLVNGIEKDYHYRRFVAQEGVIRVVQRIAAELAQRTASLVIVFSVPNDARLTRKYEILDHAVFEKRRKTYGVNWDVISREELIELSYEEDRWQDLRGGYLYSFPLQLLAILVDSHDNVTLCCTVDLFNFLVGISLNFAPRLVKIKRWIIKTDFVWFQENCSKLVSKLPQGTVVEIETGQTKTRVST